MALRHLLIAGSHFKPLRVVQSAREGDDVRGELRVIFRSAAEEGKGPKERLTPRGPHDEAAGEGEADAGVGGDRSDGVLLCFSNFHSNFWLIFGKL